MKNILKIGYTWVLLRDGVDPRAVVELLAGCQEVQQVSYTRSQFQVHGTASVEGLILPNEAVSYEVPEIVDYVSEAADAQG